MIKINMMGIGGRTYIWIKDFLFERFVQVRIGTALSRRYMVDNGTPQGSVISPLLFPIMINDGFFLKSRGILEDHCLLMTERCGKVML